MTSIRQLLGPAMIAISVWCAAGQLTVATSESAIVRLAVPARWWVFVIAAALAALVRGWKARPLLALPALLSTLPWWPLPVPPVALIWTGPMAWVPIGIALAAATSLAPLDSARGALSEVEGADFKTRPPYVPSRYVQKLVARPDRAAAVLTLVLAIVAAWAASPRVPGGDEPHYLVITQSLIKDADLRIENNHTARDYGEYFDGELRPDVIVRGRNGHAYSIHAPGLPVMVLPAFWLFGYPGAQAAILFIAALTGGVIWNLAWRVTKDRGAAWFAWAAIVASATFLIQSFTIFPDGPAALAIAAGAWLLVRLADPKDHIRTASLIGVSAALAALPWLHTRFVVLAAGLGLLVLWRLKGDRRKLSFFMALPTASAVAWFTFFYVIYGTPNPSAPYGPNPESSLAYVPGGMAGLLFDAQFGLFTYAPVLFLAVIGFVLHRRDMPSLSKSLFGIAGFYLAVVGTYWMWWGGVPATPARFAAAILPVFAIPLAVVWARGSALVRSACVAVLTGTVAISAVVFAVDRAGLAWNVRGDDARWLDWLGPVADLSRGWPSFFWRLTPGVVRTEVPFFVHVTTWLILIAGLGFGLRVLLQRRPAWKQHARYVVAWSFALGLIVLVQSGWLLNRVNGLDAAGSQVAFLEALRSGKTTIRIAPFSAGAVPDPSAVLRIRGAPPRDQESPVWASLSHLPAGNYELRFSLRRSRGGEVSLRIGRAPQPWRRLSLLPLSRQSVAIFLPADVAGLRIEADGALKDAGGSVEIVPLAARPTLTKRATTVARYRTIDVFFVDDSVFVEEAGFWIRGGATTEFVLAAGAGTAVVDLTLRNGTVDNQVRIESGSFKQSMSLRPSEERVVGIPISSADGVALVQIRSATGFRPSDFSQSGDRRYLGVRVEIK